MVQAFGFNATAMTDDELWGLDLGLNFDVGASYEWPLYNQDQYLVSRLRLHAYAGGRNYVTFHLAYVRLHVFFDIDGFKMTFFDSYSRIDIVNYSDWCTAAAWFFESARFKLFAQVDVNECLIGLVGALTDDTYDCDWSTYYINHPFFDFDAWDLVK